MTIATIREWKIHTLDEDPYKATELKSLHISGNVYGRPGFKDGDHIRSNRIVSFDRIERTVTTASGSIYRIEGPPYKEYAEAYPNWEKTLFG